MEKYRGGTERENNNIVVMIVAAKAKNQCDQKKKHFPKWNDIAIYVSL